MSGTGVFDEMPAVLVLVQVEEDGAGTEGGHGLACFGGIRLVTVLCIVGHGCIQAPVTGVALGGDGACLCACVRADMFVRLCQQSAQPRVAPPKIILAEAGSAISIYALLNQGIKC